MKQITFEFNPFVVHFNGRRHENISNSSRKRLDKTLVKLCESGQMEMCLYADFKGNQILSFESCEENEK